MKVNGGPLNGHGTGPPIGSTRNIEYKMASPGIWLHKLSKLSRLSQYAENKNKNNKTQY